VANPSSGFIAAIPFVFSAVQPIGGDTDCRNAQIQAGEGEYE